MSIIEKVWSEIMGSPPTVPPSFDKHMAPSPKSALERLDSIGSPKSSPSDSEAIPPSPFRLGDDRRYSADMAATETAKSRITKSISIASQSRPRLDTARSLPAHYGNTSISNLPSPASRKGENVWRSVFHPGSNKIGMDRVGAGRFDKANPSEPSVFDWYNPLTSI